LKISFKASDRFRHGATFAEQQSRIPIYCGWFFGFRAIAEKASLDYCECRPLEYMGVSDDQGIFYGLIRVLKLIYSRALKSLDLTPELQHIDFVQNSSKLQISYCIVYEAPNYRVVFLKQT
jgi:hypothetical protein